MRVLVMASVFPNAVQPTWGIFVKERALRVAQHCDTVVIAPYAWFPGNTLFRGKLWAGIPPVEQQDGVTVYHPRVFSPPRFGKCLDGLLYAASLLWFVRRLRRTFPFDLIDAHFAYPDGLAAAILGRIFRRPVVITLRGSLPRLSTYRLHRPQLRWALRNAARILSVSDSLKRVAMELGTPGDKVRVVPNGVDGEVFSPMDRGEARRRLGLPADAKILLSVGYVEARKGHHRIVEILPRLLRDHPNLLYLIVGGERPGSSTRPIIESLIAQHGLAPHVRLVGPQPHDAIPTWLGACDLFCLATSMEGRANVLLEALACGRPVVTTDAGGNKEILSDDAYGIVVPPADPAALERAIRDGLGRAWRGDLMVAHARSQSWDASSAAVLEEFRRLVSADPPAASRAARSRDEGAPSRLDPATRHVLRGDQ
jgi:teichuronic acid biosynthesis glycosyltransferase TuaC